MSKPDKNLFSFNGLPNGNIWLNGQILFWGKDRTLGVRRSYHLDLNGIVVNKNIADTVKISGVEDFILTITGVVDGGYEDCIDINNNAKRVTIDVIDGLQGNGRYCITCKGNSDDITITGVVLKHADYVDVALGEHSDQSIERSDRIKLFISSADGQPVTWWRFNAMTPELHRGPWKCILKVPGFFRSAFVQLVRFGKWIGLPI